MSLSLTGVPLSNNAFLSPRWGGIQIYNVLVPGNATRPHPVSVDMRAVMETAISQLRLLLGIGGQVSVLYCKDAIHTVVDMTLHRTTQNSGTPQGFMYAKTLDHCLSNLGFQIHNRVRSSLNLSVVRSFLWF